MREKFHWNVSLADINTGDTMEYKLSTYWDPHAEDAAEAVGNAAQAEAYVKSGKNRKYAPVKVERA